MIVELRASARAAQTAIGIVGNAAAQPEAAIVPALAVFHFHQLTTQAGHHGRKRYIARRRHCDVERRAREITELCGIADVGREEAGGTFHLRIGHRQIGRIQDRNAKHFQAGVAEAHLLRRLVIDHPLGLDLPERRGAAFGLADLTGAVDSTPRDDDLAVARSAGGGQPSALADQRAEAGQGAVAKSVGQHHGAGEGDIAALVCDADIATSGDAVILLVVGDAVGEQHAALVSDLDLADGGHGLVDAVILDAVGLQHHLPVRRRRRGDLRGRAHRLCGGGQRQGGGQQQGGEKE